MRRLKWTTALFVFLICQTPGHSDEQSAMGRPWTIEDSVAVRYFVQFYPDGSPTLAIPGAPVAPHKLYTPVVFSPDRQHFFAVTFHGDLSTDRVVYELQVFSSQSVQTALTQDAGRGQPARALHRITFKSAYSATSFNSASSAQQAAQAISKPFWDTNSSIMFIGVQGHEPHRIYRLDIKSGAVTALTDIQHDVAVGVMPEDAPFAVQGTSAIFTTLQLVRSDPFAGYPMRSVSDGQIQSYWFVRSATKLHASYGGATARPFASVAPGVGGFGPWFSPDGRRAVMVYAPEGASMPGEWLHYEFKPKSGFRFFLIDLQNATARQILEAPAGTVTEAGRGRSMPFGAFWSADSRRVLIYNTALPITPDLPERRRMAYILDLDVASHEWSIVTPMANSQGEKIMEAKWTRPGKEIAFVRKNEKGVELEQSIFGFNGKRWAQSAKTSVAPPPTAAATPSEFTVSLRQGVNDPPVLVASNGRQHVELTEPDPALHGVRRARATPIDWQEAGGKMIKGLLMLPWNYSEGEGRLPLVIQGLDGGEDPTELFWPDGGPSGYAAQALVEAGFCVLQIPLAYGDDETVSETPKEAPLKVRRIDQAIDILESRGIVDRTRVGAVGFSRNGYSIYYAITHPGRTPLAAAVVLDSTTYGYAEYVLGAGLDIEIDRSYESQYGKGSFWENKSGWMDAPTFNLDRVVTPVLFTDNGASIPQLETIGAFRLAQKPFDNLLFPQGGHILQRPRERATAMQATVDWMKFWLQDREPAVSTEDPGRAERWRRIKTEWQTTHRHRTTR